MEAMDTGAPSTQDLVFFDGVCNLCNAWVDFVVRRDPKGHFRFAPLQGTTAAARLPEPIRRGSAPDSVVLLRGERIYQRSSAALRVLQSLGGFYTLAGLLLLIPSPLRDLVYDFVAARRYRWFGKRESCRLPTQSEKSRFLP